METLHTTVELNPLHVDRIRELDRFTRQSDEKTIEELGGTEENTIKLYFSEISGHGRMTSHALQKLNASKMEPILDTQMLDWFKIYMRKSTQIRSPLTITPDMDFPGDEGLRYRIETYEKVQGSESAGYVKKIYLLTFLDTKQTPAIIEELFQLSRNTDRKNIAHVMRGPAASPVTLKAEIIKEEAKKAENKVAMTKAVTKAAERTMTATKKRVVALLPAATKKQEPVPVKTEAPTAQTATPSLEGKVVKGEVVQEGLVPYSEKKKQEVLYQNKKAYAEEGMKAVMETMLDNIDEVKKDKDVETYYKVRNGFEKRVNTFVRFVVHASQKMRQRKSLDEMLKNSYSKLLTMFKNMLSTRMFKDLTGTVTEYWIKLRNKLQKSFSFSKKEKTRLSPVVHNEDIREQQIENVKRATKDRKLVIINGVTYKNEVKPVVEPSTNVETTTGQSEKINSAVASAPVSKKNTSVKNSVNHGKQWLAEQYIEEQAPKKRENFFGKIRRFFGRAA